MKLSDVKFNPNRDTREQVKAYARQSPVPTQTEVARALGITRSRVGQIAKAEGLTFTDGRKSNAQQ